MSSDNRRTYVLDTSVLLSSPRALYAFEEHEVVLPVVVLKELEEKRTHPTLGYNARTVLRALEKLRTQPDADMRKGVIVTPEGGTVRIEINHVDTSHLPDAIRADKSNDTRILSVADGLKRKGENVILVSKDLPMRLLAHGALNIPAEEYRHEQVEDSGYTGLVEIEVTTEQVDALYHDGVLDIGHHDYLVNTGIILVSPTSSGLARVAADKKLLQVRGDMEAFGIHGRSAEQRIALSQLMDTSISAVSLGGYGGTGKMELLTNRIPVPVSDRFPSGWATIGQLEVGDTVYSINGEETPILGLSPVKEDDVYELVFDDGTVVACGPDHLWKVSSNNSRMMNNETRTGIRDTRRELFQNEANEWRRLAREIGSGLVLSRVQLAKLTGKGTTLIAKLTPESLKVTVGVPQEKTAEGSSVGTLTLVKIEGYPADEVLILLAERLEAQSLTSDSGIAAQPVCDIVSTKDMYERQQLVSSMPKTISDWGVPVSKAIEGEGITLPLDPYVMGVYLGDGTRRTGGITSADPFIHEEILRAGFITQRIYDKKGTTAKTYFYKGLRELLISTGFEMNPKNPGPKFIPPVYLRASKAQRLALLQGLMDTDGYLGKNGATREICFTSYRLSCDTLELIRSLGIKASMSSGPAVITEIDPNNSGQKIRRVTGTRYRIYFSTEEQVFRLPRKIEKSTLPTRDTKNWHYVTDIRKLETKEKMRCISIADPSHLYLTGDFIPTHNSVLALAAALELVVEQNQAKRIVVFRPLFSVGGQDLGFLPGTEAEKMAPYTAAVKDALDAITTDTAINEILARGQLEVMPLTYIRGRTLTDTIVILDEAQNLERSTILTAISRLGKGSRIFLTHDVAQRDNLHVGRFDGIAAVVERLKGDPLFAHVTLTRSERSPIAALATRLLDDFIPEN